MIQYLTENIWQLWAIIAVVCLVIELSAGDFFVMCFAIGAAVTTLFSLFFGGYVQLGVFALSSLLCVFFVRPFALRYLHKKESGRVSNVDALIGKHGFVTQKIPQEGSGRVAAGGDDWKAVSADASTIEEGTPVTVVGRDGLVVTVERN